jgi:hypothetical protein
MARSGGFLASPPVTLRRYEKIRTRHCERQPCGYQTLFMRATGIVDFSSCFFSVGHSGGRIPQKMGRQFHCRSRRDNTRSSQREMEFREERVLPTAAAFPNEIWEPGENDISLAHFSRRSKGGKSFVFTII